MPSDLIDSVIVAARDAAEPTTGTHRPWGLLRRWVPPLAAAVLVGAIAVALVIANRAGPRSSTPPTNPPGSFEPVAQWRTFSTSSRIPFTVRYPAAWHAYQDDYGGSFSVGIAYFSSQQIPDPCHTSETDNAISCAPPVLELHDGDVVIQWALVTQSGSITHQRGQPITINGHAAKISITAPTESICLRSDATRQVAIVIAKSAGRVQMTACLSATTTDTKQLTDAVVTSARTVDLGQ
jgi:hypothetical protein